MSNVIKDSLSEGDIDNIPMSITEEESEHEEESELDEEKPQVNQDIKEDKSKKKTTKNWHRYLEKI